MNIYYIKYAAGARLLDVSSDFGTTPNFESSTLDPQYSSNDLQQPRIRYATYHLPWTPLDIPDIFTDDEKVFYQISNYQIVGEGRVGRGLYEISQEKEKEEGEVSEGTRQGEGSGLGEAGQEGNEEKRELHVSAEGDGGGGGGGGGGEEGGEALGASSKQVEP